MKKILIMLFIFLLTSCITDPSGDKYVVEKVIKHSDGFTQYDLKRIYDSELEFAERYVYFEYESNDFIQDDTLYFDENKKLVGYKKKN